MPLLILTILPFDLLCVIHVFPLRKAIKLTFVCFQLQFFSPCILLNIFKIIRPVHTHLKKDKVDLKKKTLWKISFLHFFAIHSTSKHEKRCRMPEIIFCVFQCFRVFCAIVFGSSCIHTRKRHYVASRKYNEILNWHIDRYFFSGQ